MFVRHPTPGEAKTRLMPELGPDGAALAARLLAQAELVATRPLEREYRRTVCFTPPAAADAVAAWLPGEALRPQADGDLGRRMSAAFDEAFAEGAERVVLIGSDVPTCTRERVLEAFEALADHDLVLGPAVDGGYYLIGLTAPRPDLFEDVEWGTAGVLGTTLERARRLDLRVRRLEPLRDVDTWPDLLREWPSLRRLLCASDADRLGSMLAGHGE